VRVEAAIYGTLVCVKVEEEDGAVFWMGELRSLSVGSNMVVLELKDGYRVSGEIDRFSTVYPSGYNSFKYWCAEREEEVREFYRVKAKTEGREE